MSIHLRNVHKSYNKQFAIKNINLEIASGELFVLLGASGSGKSTILRVIAGLLPVDQGQIILNDVDVTRLDPQVRDTGFVFQNYSLFGHMTVAENIAFGLSVRRKSRQEMNARVAELLALVELSDYGNRIPSQLSGGQQQRVALARALAPNPKVLLLDEPFGALDVKIRAQLRQNLKRIQEQFNITTVLVTHDQEEAFELADRIGVIEQGEILEINTPDQLYRRPQTRYTATFVGQANLLKGERNSTHVILENGTRIPATDETADLHGRAVEVLCRPEEIELTTTPEASQGVVIGKGRVQEIIFTGHYLRVMIELDAEIVSAWTSPASVRELGLEVGSTVFVALRDYHLLAG